MWNAWEKNTMPICSLGQRRQVNKLLKKREETPAGLWIILPDVITCWCPVYPVLSSSKERMWCWGVRHCSAGSIGGGRLSSSFVRQTSSLQLVGTQRVESCDAPASVVESRLKCWRNEWLLPFYICMWCAYGRDSLLLYPYRRNLISWK